jgi:hypothetical protein
MSDRRELVAKVIKDNLPCWLVWFRQEKRKECAPHITKDMLYSITDKILAALDEEKDYRLTASDLYDLYTQKKMPHDFEKPKDEPKGECTCENGSLVRVTDCPIHGKPTKKEECRCKHNESTFGGWHTESGVKICNCCLKPLPTPKGECICSSLFAEAHKKMISSCSIHGIPTPKAEAVQLPDEFTDADFTLERAVLIGRINLIIRYLKSREKE